MPADLSAALLAAPSANARFAALNRAEHYSVLHPIVASPNEAVRASRLANILAGLESE